MPPLLRGDPPAYRHPPYQGGQGGSNLKSIFNLIINNQQLMISRYVVLWLPMIVIGISNGILRESTYGKYLDELRAHQISSPIEPP